MSSISVEKLAQRINDMVDEMMSKRKQKYAFPYGHLIEVKKTNDDEIIGFQLNT